MRHFQGVAAATVVMVGSAVAGLGAEDRPTLSVAAFTVTRSPLSPTEAAELADDLAARLEETGRFRVMPREWLPAGDASRKTVRLDVLRRAAIDAGVSYLVLPSVTGLIAARARIHPLAGVGRAIAGLTTRRRAAFGCGPARPEQAQVAVEVRIIDAATGDVVTTSVLRTRVGPPVSDGLHPGCGSGPGAGALGMAAALSRSDHLAPLRQANADIARTLAVPSSGAHDAGR